MNEQLQQQVIQLVQAAMQGDQKAQQTIEQIMGAAQQGDEQATQIAQMIQAIAQQMQQGQVQAAKFGAKLDYTRQLRGLCPEGYEMQYFKSGGRLCKKCVAKQKKMEEGGEVPSNPVDSFKCGRKMKKKVEKAEDGGKQYIRSGYDPYNDEYSDTTFVKKNGKEQIVKVVKSDETGSKHTTYYENGKPKNAKSYTGQMKSDKIEKHQDGKNMVKKIKTVTTYPERLEANERTVQYYDDGTYSVMNHGWEDLGQDVKRWTASFRGRQGEFGDYSGTPKQQQIADSIHEVDFRHDPMYVPAIKHIKLKLQK